MALSVIADKVVDVKLLALALPEVHVAISDITFTPGTHWFKRFSLGFLRGPHCASIAILR